MKVTEESYRESALAQIEVAQSLIAQRQYPLANYLAGLSVECMLRAYGSRTDTSFDARHDLRRWYEKSSLEEAVSEGQRQSISTALSIVASHWNNSQRYYSVEIYRAEIKQALLDRGIKGDPVKEITRRTVNASLEIVIVGDAQWKNYLRKLSRS